MGQEGTFRVPVVSKPAGLIVQNDGADRALSLDGRVPFYRTTNDVIAPRLTEVPGSPIRLVLWEEILPNKAVVPFYAISLDGRTIATVRRTSYVLKLRYGDFDPGVGEPVVEARLAADASADLYIVQFVTQPLEEFRNIIEELGGKVHRFLANHAQIVGMSRGVRDQVAALPFVRWVGRYHPAYRLEEALLDECKQYGMPLESRRYHIQLVEGGFKQTTAVADRVRAVGGTVETVNPNGVLLGATLDPQQFLDVARMNEVLFIDRRMPRELYMNNVREDGGANHVESVGGYTGEGVRAEVMDSGLLTSHAAFQARPPIIHHCNSSSTWHGTSVYGINFGDGTGNVRGRGAVPDAQGIFSSFACLTDRYQHTTELVQAPYFAVYQTNSWGACCTTAYGTDAAEMDRIIFDTDLLILQAQANEGSRNSDVSAWAKNVVSVGGIHHEDTLPRADDDWSFAGSIGPAADGRVKPDLAYWYDSILTTSNSGGYTPGFGGTSAATPETAAHFGLFFQMWADGIFGNEVDPGGTVFENRCHASTAKAVLINTAHQYPFSGAGHDLTRVHQGWGTADVGFLYDMRHRISVIDETEVIANLETVTYAVFVDSGEPALRVTMVYTDPPGTSSSSQHRINDLTLKVTSPSGAIYWGNHGLLDGNWSAPGGDPNTIDTVENVFVEFPGSGIWTVDVLASEVNEDGHVETPELDADFALVVSGALLSTCSSEGRITLDAGEYACADQATISVVDCDLNTDDGTTETVIVIVNSDTEPGGESVLLTETAPSTANFKGAIGLSTIDAPSALHVSEGDTVTATYVDANNGQGGTNLVVTDAAAVDCTEPVVSNVNTTSIAARSATVTFETDEFSRCVVRYGSACVALIQMGTESGLRTDHTVNLSGLDTDTTYFYAVDAEDKAGNTGTDDNGGACHVFTTLASPDYFTQQFIGDFDLDNKTVTFRPDGSTSFYGACLDDASAFPTDPTGGTTLSLEDDDFVPVVLSGGEKVSLYGTYYGTLYVGSNGYITFSAGDGAFNETLPQHFALPRISALFADFSPTVGGTISWRQLVDGVAVTYENVPEFDTSNLNSFQVEMFFDSTIRVTWLSMHTGAGISGLSAGNGVPPEYFESDLSTYVGGVACDSTRPPPCDDVPGSLGARYLRADCSAGVGAAEVLRVRFVSLDGYSIPSRDFLFVGPPHQAPEEDASIPGQTFTAAPLQCGVYVHAWPSEGIVSVYGAEIMPGSTYQVQRAFVDCPNLENDDACWSEPLTITTGKYGDVSPIFDAPGSPAQPDFNDIAAMVRKFQSTPSECGGGANDGLPCAGAGDCPSGSCDITAPLKSTCQLQPNTVFPERAIDFKDIATDVGAFTGTAYSAVNFGPCLCPSAVTCGAAGCASDVQCGTGLCVGGFCGDECGRCTP